MRAKARQKLKEARAEKPIAHRMVSMAIPPRDATYQVSPFTAKVIALPANRDMALVFTRRRETFCQIAGKVGAAIKAAQRRDPEKQFIKRRIEHEGSHTYAIWRVR